MKRILSVGLSVMMVVLLSTTLNAQNSTYVKIGGAFPVGEFGESESDNYMGASEGVMAGLKYVHELSENGLGLFGELDIMFNPLSDNVKKIDSDKVKYSKYFNVPISAGLDYTFNPSGNISLYADAGVVFNILKMTDLKIDGDSYIEYGAATNFGFKLEAGAILFKRISAGVAYYGLGSHTIDRTVSTGSLLGSLGSYSASAGEITRKVNFFTVMVGFRIN